MSFEPIPRKPLIAEPLYLVRYIEKAGSGTLDMIERCNDAGLPSPDFEERSGQFVTTLWRDLLTDEIMKGLGLSERQLRAVIYIKTHGRITSAEYQRLADVSRQTATRDLDEFELVQKSVASRYGAKRGSHYVLK
ncbi:MAG: transcriptional regulator [Deltaproteobacteria bacterium]|nr:transcriptional regulator [Deltaproteobacteria bacterium]